eukprot:Lankesteria_metandrocarpae@DN1423_c0_g1_i1.p1
MGIFAVLTDKEKAKQLFTTYKTGWQAWGLFSAIVCVIFFVFSDGDFSFLLTLSSLIGMFSFVMVLYKLESAKSAKGISLVMIECYVIVLAFRLFSIIPFEGYLPYDRSGDWLYQATEAVSCLLAGTIMYLCRVRYKTTYDQECDTLKHYLLILPALVLSLLFHPSLNAFMPADAAWTFALYLEAVCCLPQLFMFQKQGRVEPFTTHFLAGQALSKCVSFIFWVASFKELNDPTKMLKSYVGVWVIALQALQLLVMGDFIYHYIRCVSQGVSVQFILADNV